MVVLTAAVAVVDLDKGEVALKAAAGLVTITAVPQPAMTLHSILN